MLKQIIKLSIKHRVLVLLASLILSVMGWVSAQNMMLDAIPDLSDVQVIVRTSYAGQSPKIIEDQITQPLTTALLSVPNTEVVRGYSFFGDSYIYIIFKQDTDLYWARSRVLESLSQIKSRLPSGVNPRLGTDATGVGWVFSYALIDKTGQHDISQLRSLQDWFLKPELQSVSGVAEVATVGGMVRQYQIIIQPDKLLSYQINLSQLINAIGLNNQETGGSVIEMAEAEYMIHTQGYLRSVEDIEQIPVKRLSNGSVLLLRDVAYVQLGPEIRRAATDLDGKGEVTGGIVVMRSGENALTTINAVKQKLDQLSKGLPEGVEIITTYDRSTLINNVIDNLVQKLSLEFVFIVIICVVFLFHFQSALVAVLSLPVGILMAFIIMQWQEISLNIMSLAGIAIAIGTMTDAAIVMIENTHKHLEKWHQAHPKQSLNKTQHWQIISTATEEVGGALFLSLLIITFSFIPIFTLDAQEGRMFSPLAYTKTYAMAASALLAVTLIPVLIGYLIKGRLAHEQANPINRVLNKYYQQALQWVLVRSQYTMGVALLILASVVMPIFGLNGLIEPFNKLMNTHVSKINGLASEFMPPLFEGDLMYMPTTLPGISLAKAQQLLQQTNQLIATVPEVERVFGKVGRADTATDPAPLNMIETIIQLKPQAQWRKGLTLNQLIEELDDLVNFPGLTNAWVMPIKTRIDMLSTGIKTPLGIKISGTNLKGIEEIGKQIESVLHGIEGTRSVIAERITGGRYIEVIPDRAKLAYLGLNIADINTLVQSAIGGKNIAYLVEEERRYPINLRFPRTLRDDIQKIKQLPIISSSGLIVTLEQVAELKIVEGAAVIKTENSRLQGWVLVDTKDIDLKKYIKSAKQQVSQLVSLPAGYSISWEGQHQSLLRAEAKLYQLIPITLCIILFLLYLIFHNFSQALMVMLTLPFALVGGVWLMFLLDYKLSIASGVGFIALSGMAIEFGVIMLLYLDKAIEESKNKGSLNDLKALHTAVISGAVQRIRPKAMTVAVIVFGLLPMMLGQGAGSDIMQRIAAPILGGMITAPLLSLFITPIIYLYWQQRKLDKITKESLIRLVGI